ncbi:MAG: hypothetical protein J6V93_04315, partial [Clostridia bacterium]|nr:hypothetical protein [Clostridia bacterium]
SAAAEGECHIHSELQKFFIYTSMHKTDLGKVYQNKKRSSSIDKRLSGILPEIQLYIPNKC